MTFGETHFTKTKIAAKWLFACLFCNRVERACLKNYHVLIRAQAKATLPIKNRAQDRAFNIFII